MYHIGNAKIYLFHINWSKPQMWKKIFWILFFKDGEKQNDEHMCMPQRDVLQIIE